MVVGARKVPLPPVWCRALADVDARDAIFGVEKELVVEMMTLLGYLHSISGQLARYCEKRQRCGGGRVSGVLFTYISKFMRTRSVHQCTRGIRCVVV